MAQRKVSLTQRLLFHNITAVEREQDIHSKRLQVCITKLRQGADDLWLDGKLVVAKKDWIDYRLHIISENNFPTAAGLASSASGLACFGEWLIWTRAML